jgi:hypothetical protein
MARTVQMTDAQITLLARFIESQLHTATDITPEERETLESIVWCAHDTVKAPDDWKNPGDVLQQGMVYGWCI